MGLHAAVRGQIESVDDLGDVATAADDRCTRTTYARKTGPWLMNLASRVETVATSCDKTPSFPGDAVTDVLNDYDAAGNLTRTRSLSTRPASGDPGYYTTGSSVYDEHGRVVESRDAMGEPTRTTYTPATGGPVTQSVTTNPLGHTVTTTLEPAWGLPVTVVDANKRKTEIAYDALGRSTEVWLPNRPRTKYPDAGSAKFSYLVRGNGPTVVMSSTLNANGNYLTTKEIYDGLLRLRQKQVPAVGGGRLLTDTRYDSQGRAYKNTQPYFNDAAIDDNIWVASDTEIPGHTVTLYDGAGRTVAEVYKAGAVERWRTTTAYGGDRVHLTPAAGGTATTTITDGRGQTVELRQYHGGTPSGAYDSTTYTYTKAGQLASTKDPGGNVWRIGYDIRGNKTRHEDPDRGTSTTTYNDAGLPVTATDAKGVTLTTVYDKLGRKLTVKTGDTLLAQWTYDTAFKGLGQLASSTRYVDGAAYTRSIANYTELYHPYETTVTIPETPRTQTLARSYTTYSTLNWDGSANGTTLPAIGDLGKETVSQEYDELGNPTKLTGGPEGTGTFEYVTKTGYTRYGETERIQLGATGKRAWLSFYYEDSTRRLTRTIVDVELPRPMRTDVNYTYDPTGNVTSIANTPMDLPHDVQCFRYDHLRRLTDVWTPGGGCDAAPNTGSLAGAAPYWHSYTYDTVGNRLTETQHAAAGNTERTYGYPVAGAHKVAAVTTAGPSGTKTDAFTYDGTGNTLTRPGQALEWDPLGKLAQVSEGDKKTRFVYDADGERLLREDPATITVYLDGQDLTLTKATGKLAATRYYQHGDDTVATRTASGVSWEAGDHQGTAQVSVDAASQKVAQRRLTPFGAPRGAPVPWVGDKGFVGGRIDSSTGLTNIGARQYDPLLGRFVSVDPLMDPTDPQQLHGYTYSNNNPVTLSDPTGLGFLSWLGRTVRKAIHAVAEVTKWVAPVAGLVAIVATGPVGLFAAGLAFGAGLYNAAYNCSGGGNAVDCGLDVAGSVLGAGKLVAGAARTAWRQLRLTQKMKTSVRAHDAGAFTDQHRLLPNGGGVRRWADGRVARAEEKVGEFGPGKSGYLYNPTLGEGVEAVGRAVTYASATTTGGCEFIVQICDTWPKTSGPFADTDRATMTRSGFPIWLPLPSVSIYPYNFIGPIPVGAVRAKKHWPIQSRPGKPTPPKQPATQPAPNPDIYKTKDDRICNRGGGMCAI